MIAVTIFGSLLLLTIIARLHLLPDNTDPKVEATPDDSTGSRSTLFVYVHGLDGGSRWDAMKEILKPHGDTLKISYSRARLSNANPLVITQRISSEIEKQFKQGSYKDVILIGQSMGALLVKRTFLDAERDGLLWVKKVYRIVLVAGMNRGWDISGQKPSDMSKTTWAFYWFGSWLARVGGFGKLILSMETGAPFVSNLRMDWLSRMSKYNGEKKCNDKEGHNEKEEHNYKEIREKDDVQVVQLLGDIDDLVSSEDNKDLRAISNKPFAWIKVRGTGHKDIVDFTDSRTIGNVSLGEYRKLKFKLATTEKDFNKLARENEVLSFQPDPEVTHVVFVVHGIRDLGEWAAALEQELQKKFSKLQPKGTSNKLVVASIRYGYFGMGPFLFKPIREKYVKWLMDEYTETLAHYPNAKQVHFVGHSNGTYLLAAALDRYTSLNIGRIVFGGSVVRHDYDWRKILEHRQYDLEGDKKYRVVNYTANDDWVVALFPRFFEPDVMSFLHNDIGSAGFNGFSKPMEKVKNVKGLSGGHGAFLYRLPEIATFILNGGKPAESLKAQKNDENRPWYTPLLTTVSEWGANWGTWFIVWPFLAIVIIFVGWHVTTAASEPRWPFLLAYTALVVTIFRHV